MRKASASDGVGDNSDGPNRPEGLGSILIDCSGLK